MLFPPSFHPSPYSPEIPMTSYGGQWQGFHKRACSVQCDNPYDSNMGGSVSVLGN